MNRGTTRRVGLGWLPGLMLLLLLDGGCDVQGGKMALRPSLDDEDVWAIRCLTLSGPNRFRVANSYADALKKVGGLKPELVRIFHEAGESVVYYGRYRRLYNAKNGTEAFRPGHLDDLDLIRRLSLNVPDPAVGTRTVWPFRLATMDTLPTGRGAHPEWLLSNAPGYYSLQVAVFYNTEGMRQRKYAAEEYCKLLREQGEEAYYHHGRVNSSVCIGAFPEEAIQTFQYPDPLTGAIRVKSKIVDERVLALQRKFPHNLHNGSTFYEITRDPKTGREHRDPHTSFAVEIPRAEQGAAPFEK
ncbi:MAG: hypothetical protein ACE5I3_07405 [Phycisphaerae bacterium]